MGLGRVFWLKSSGLRILRFEVIYDAGVGIQVKRYLSRISGLGGFRV